MTVSLRMLPLVICSLLAGCTEFACPDAKDIALNSFLGGRIEGYHEGHADGMQRVCENVKGEHPEIHQTLVIRGLCGSRWQDPTASPK
jgi:hypothetical protein